MIEHVEVYDLSDGEPVASEGSSASVDHGAVRSRLDTLRRAAASTLAERAHRASEGPWSGALSSLSLFIPGAGQMVRGEFTLGAFYLCWMGFMASLTWAVLQTVDRLVPTLGHLGLPSAAVFWTLAVVFALAAATHLAGVFTAVSRLLPRDHVCHPVASGIASFLVPGWGQLLNGDRLRAALFLGGMWAVVGTWIAASGTTAGLLDTFAPAVPRWEEFARQPSLLWMAQWTAPAVIWTLSVYDAVSRANRSR